MKGAATALSAAIIFSCLIAVHGQADRPTIRSKLSVRFKEVGMDAEYAETFTTLEQGFGSIELFVENDGDTAKESVQYKLYLSELCIRDGSEKRIHEATVNVASGGSSFALKDVETKGNALPCGIVCLFANVTHEDLYGVARVDAVVHCNNKGIDLELKSNVNPSDGPFSIELDQKLVDVVPGLSDVWLENVGNVTKRSRTKDMLQSVAVVVRPELFTDEDVMYIAMGECNYGTTSTWSTPSTWPTLSTRSKPSTPSTQSTHSTQSKRSTQSTHSTQSTRSTQSTHSTKFTVDMGPRRTDQISTTTAKGEERKKRSVKGRSKRAFRPGYGDYDNEEDYESSMYQLHLMFGNWAREREEMNIQPGEMPECFSFGMLNEDIPLDGGDIIANDELEPDEKVKIDLSKVTFKSAKKNLCALSNNYGGTERQATVNVIIDPMRMNNDINLCNNYISFNVTYRCEEDVTEYDNRQCEIRVDPLSRGHKAEVHINEQTSLLIDGDNMELDYNMHMDCKELEYYKRATKNLRWDFLADRLQRDVEQDPDLCAITIREEIDREQDMFEVEEEEAAKEREREREEAAMERETTEVNQGSDSEADVMMEKLIKDIQDFKDQIDDAMNNDDELAETLFCLGQGIRWMGNMLKVSDEVLVNFQTVMKGWHNLVEEFGPFNVECGGSENDLKDAFQVLLDASEGTNKGDLLTDALDKYQTEQQDSAANEDESFKDKLLKLTESLDQANKCPGSRGHSSNGNLGKVDQIISLGKIARDAKSSDNLRKWPLSNTTCGLRRLRQDINRRNGKLSNRDLAWAVSPYTEKDRDVKFLQYLAAVSDIIEAYPDYYSDQIQEKVNMKMDKIVDDEMNACASTRDQILEDQTRVDDTYDVNWRIEDGWVYKSSPDIFNASFATGDYNKLLWTPVASCFCSQCSNDDMVEPAWMGGNGGVGGRYGTTTYRYWESTSTPTTDSG